MNLEMYTIPFSVAFIITTILSVVIIFFSRNINFYNRAAQKKFTKKGVSRLGGVAIILGFFGAIFLNKNLFISQTLTGIIVASIIILFVGTYDDLRRINWKIQLFFQICVAILIFIFGVQIDFITNPLGGTISLDSLSASSNSIGGLFVPSLFIGIGWIVLMMNAINWLDGLDGLSSGVTLLGVIAIFFLSLKPEVNQPPVGIITMALAGSLVAFLIFNFHPAKILAGTSGSMFMGFILASLSIFAGTKIATALLVMAVPLIDVFLVIFGRIKAGETIFKADYRHLHYRLLDIGWSPKKVVLFFYIITFLITIIALNTREIGKIITITAVLIITILTSWIIGNMEKSTKEKDMPV